MSKDAFHTSITAGQSDEMVRVRVAVVQLECHPAFAIGHTDWLSEPFFSSKGPCLEQLKTHGFTDSDELRRVCRGRYMQWAERRLEGILSWFKNRFPKNADDQWAYMPDLIVFPEGSVPRPHLHHLVRFARETGATIFAGTHTFEISEDSARDYNRLGITWARRRSQETDAERDDFQEFVKAGYGEIHPCTSRELMRILGKALPSIAVLPVITPCDTHKRSCSKEEFHGREASYDAEKARIYLSPDEFINFGEAEDQTRECFVKLRAKSILSPFELTEGEAGYVGESPEVIEISLPSDRIFRKDGKTISVLPLVCSEALNLLEKPPTKGKFSGKYSIAIISSFNEKFDCFDPVLRFHSNQQIPVAYCNDGAFGDSIISFERDPRHAAAFYGGLNKGRLPKGDGILVADVTLGYGGVQVAVNNPRRFYSLECLSAIVHRNPQNPPYHVSRVLNAARQLMCSDTSESNSASDNNPFSLASKIRRRLDRVSKESTPTEIQTINLKHLITLLADPCNAYPSEWRRHAFDCVIEPCVSNTSYTRRSGTDDPYPNGRSHRNLYTSLQDLDSDLAAICYIRSGKWFEHELDGPDERNPEKARVLTSVRQACRKRMGNVLDRVLAQLERVKDDARGKAKERLHHHLGTLVERFGATSGWLFPVEELFDGEGSQITSNKELILSHNTTARYDPRLKPDEQRRGIVDFVRRRSRGYLSNAVQNYSGTVTDPYYRNFMFTTRSEMAVPIFESPLTATIRADDVSAEKQEGPKLLAILNLESNRFGAFSPILLGELQSTVAQLVPDLIVFCAGVSLDYLTAWHPMSHGWGSTGILDLFCYAVATAVARGGEPSLTCTIWNYDVAKQVLQARSTVGFDYEYLTGSVLPMESYSGKIIDEYAKQDRSTDVLPIPPLRQLELLGPRVHRLNLLAARSEPDETKVGWEHFNRKRKVRNMGMAELIVAPIFRRLRESQESRDEPTETAVGSLNLYIYSHYPVQPPQILRNILDDGLVLRLAEYASRMVTDFYVLQRRVVLATLAARLAEWSHLGIPPFEIVKKTLLECLEADGCSILCARPAENEKVASIRCVATSGISWHGVAINPDEALYPLDDLKQHESNIQALISKSEGKPYAIAGITKTLLSRGGRTIRLLDVADIQEIVKIQLNSESPYPSTKVWGKSQRADEVNFSPIYRCCESMNPAESYHHRYLGVSFGKADRSDESSFSALGALRLIRGMYTRPFVRHDEIILQEIGRTVAPLFESWEFEQRRYNEQIKDFLGHDHDAAVWPLPLVRLSGDFGSQRFSDSTIPAGARSEAVRRLVYASVGAVEWNRSSIRAFLQDLLTVFANDGAVLSDVRFTVVTDDGNVTLRPYEVLSRFSQEPPDEIFSVDVASRHPNNGWKAIFQAQPFIFYKLDTRFTRIHRDSDQVRSGICVPFKFFAHDHAVDGVFSIDLNIESSDGTTDPAGSLACWQEEHIRFLALVTRQFAWMALSNNKRLMLTVDEIAKIESGASEAWKFMTRSVRRELEDHKHLIRLRNVVIRLYDSESLVDCVIADPPEAGDQPVLCPRWYETLATEQRNRDRFLDHRVDSNHAELELYGATICEARDSDPQEFYDVDHHSEVFVFPLFIGAACVGHLQAICDSRLDTEIFPVEPSAPKWSKHDRELRHLLSRVTDYWSQFVYGNLIFGKPQTRLWHVSIVTSDGDPLHQFALRYTWGDWAQTFRGNIPQSSVSE